MDISNWLGFVAFATGSVVFLVIGVAMHVQTRAFLRNAVTTQGQVVELERHLAGHSYKITTSAPIVEFKTRSGQTMRFEPIIATFPAVYNKGDTVRVVYQPGRPADARIGDFLNLHAATCVAAACSGGSLLGALIEADGFFGLGVIDDGVLWAIVFAVFGIVVAVTAASVGWRALTFLRNVVTTTGVVAEKPDIPGMDALKSIAPAVIRFRTAAGTEIEFSDQPEWGGPTFETGARIPVFYDPARPGSARTSKPLRSLYVSATLVLAGTALFLFALCMAFGWLPV